MDKLINLPFQGVMNAILHIIPRRCHRSPRRCHRSPRRCHRFPRRCHRSPRRCHRAELRYGFQPCKMDTVRNIVNIELMRVFWSSFNLCPERAILIQPNGNALGYDGNASGYKCAPHRIFRPERAI